MPNALGRFVEHDPRSWDYPAIVSPTTTDDPSGKSWSGAIRDVAHHHHGNALDQGDLGSCTGNAMASMLMCGPFWVHGEKLTEQDALKFYELATTLDNAPGSYPPDDTGSSGLAVAKAAKKLGYAKSYHHAFGLQHALQALVVAPVITGVNWYEGFDDPDAAGHVAINGNVRGGHEFCVLGIDATAKTVRAINSWGTSWGDKGYFTFTWDDWDRLLSEQGDVTTILV